MMNSVEYNNTSLVLYDKAIAFTLWIYRKILAVLFTTYVTCQRKQSCDEVHLPIQSVWFQSMQGI